MIGFLLIVGACALWAVDTLIRYPLVNNGMDSLLMVFYEHLLLSSVLVIIAVKSLPKLKKAKLNHIFCFIMVGGVGSALATLAFTQAFVFINPSLVILLQKFQPLVAIVLAGIVLKEKIQKVFILWALVCLLGALLISYEDILKLVNSDKEIKELLFHPGALQGYILTLFSVFGWGAATVFGKKLSLEGYSDDLILAGRFSMGLLFLIPFIVIGQTPIFTDSLEVYSKISLLVFVSGLLGMFLYYQGLRRIPARLCTLAEMFFPFMGVIVNWLFLDAVLTPLQLIGGLVLISGSMVIQVKHY